MGWIKYNYANTHEWMAILNKPGVYVIYGNDEVIYIGQSRDVKKRLLDRSIRYSYSNYIITPWGHFEKIYIKVSYSRRHGDWAMRELRLIKRLQPKHNCVFSIKKRASA